MAKHLQDTPEHPGERPLRVWHKLGVTLLCGGLLSVLHGLSQDPAWVETHVVGGAPAVVSRMLSRLTSLTPVSVAEVGLAVILLRVLWLALSGLSDVLARRRRWWHALAGAVLWVGSRGSVGVLLFMGLWGLSYRRAPAVERLGWQERVPPSSAQTGGEVADEDAEQLRAWVTLSVDRVNAAYRAIHGSDDAGAPTEPRKGLDVDAAIAAGFARSATSLGLGAEVAKPRGGVKQPFASALMATFGVGGIYIPFTGEAHVSAELPAWAQVHTRAHEMAHQRMIASEDEANFFGFLACVGSDEPLLRYAAWQHARSQLTAVLRRLDREAALAAHEALLPGPRRDLEALRDYHRKYEGPAVDLGSQVNDLYLKANRVEGGVLAYGRAARLIAAWLQTDEGRRRVAGERAVRSQTRRKTPTEVDDGVAK